LPLNETSLCFPSTPFLMEDFTPWSGIERLQSACLGITLLDIKALFPNEEHLFTPRETVRAQRMGPRRQRGFTAARVALKGLARQLGLVEENRPDRTIETLGPDEVRPCLAESPLYCSVSHSARFVVAVAHRHPIGVDLEAVSGKAIRAWHLFMLPGEQNLISHSGLNPERTATRVWTIKEAAAKALGLHLFQASREVEVLRVGEAEGVISYQKKTYPVRHVEGEGHVITLLTCDDL